MIPACSASNCCTTKGLILGAYDARLTGRDGDPAATGPDFDPSSAAVMGPFSAAMNSYVRSELKFEDDLPYELLAGVQPWNYGARNSYPNASDRLASVMNQNPYLKILVCGGRCDLVCPIDTIRHSLDHMPLAEAYRKNVHVRGIRRRPHDVYQPAGPAEAAGGNRKICAALTTSLAAVCPLANPLWPGARIVLMPNRGAARCELPPSRRRLPVRSAAILAAGVCTLLVRASVTGGGTPPLPAGADADATAPADGQENSVARVATRPRPQNTSSFPLTPGGLAA